MPYTGNFSYVFPTAAIHLYVAVSCSSCNVQDLAQRCFSMTQLGNDITQGAYSQAQAPAVTLRASGCFLMLTEINNQNMIVSSGCEKMLTTFHPFQYIAPYLGFRDYILYTHDINVLEAHLAIVDLSPCMECAWVVDPLHVARLKNVRQRECRVLRQSIHSPAKGRQTTSTSKP